jgi:hypothetical protein
MCVCMQIKTVTTQLVQRGLNVVEDRVKSE